jgi:hypothetical protein
MNNLANDDSSAITLLMIVMIAPSLEAIRIERVRRQMHRHRRVEVEVETRNNDGWMWNTLENHMLHRWTEQINSSHTYHTKVSGV